MMIETDLITTVWRREKPGLSRMRPSGGYPRYYNKTETFNRDRRAENIGGPHWKKGILTVG